MENELKKLNARLKILIRLLPPERQKIRRNLAAFVAYHPVRPAAREAVKKTAAWTALFFGGQWRASLAGAALAILVFAGVSAAAEGALPGDLLYPVKINVNEKARGLWASATGTRLNLDVVLAERRLAETAALSRAGRLTNEKRQRLEAKLEEHFTDFQKEVVQSDGETSKVDVVAVASDLETSLLTHEAALGILASQKDELASELAPLIVKVREKTAVVREIKSALGKKPSPAAPAGDREMVLPPAPAGGGAAAEIVATTSVSVPTTTIQSNGQPNGRRTFDAPLKVEPAKKSEL